MTAHNLRRSMIAAIMVIGGTVGAPPAGADPVTYPSCPAKEDPDCFLLNRVNDTVFAIPPGQEGRVIAQAHAACEFMAADRSGTNPMLDYGVWYSRQSGGQPMTIDSAAQFALYAAKAYCPTLLP